MCLCVIGATLITKKIIEKNVNGGVLVLQIYHP